MSVVPTPIDGRTWTARIVFGTPARAAVHAAHSDHARTMRDTGEFAIAQARGYLATGSPFAEARVYLDKTTKARGTEEDRQYAYLWFEDGKVHVDRW